MVVQRKWMYLESIFIGGDIRAQLPEEAKKFDDIDKTFKKVCNFWYSNKTWKKCSCEIMAKEEQFFRLLVSFPSQGFHWSGNGKRKWKFLRARKSQEKRDILKKHLADLVPLKAERNIRGHCDLNDLNDLNEEGNFCWTIIHLNERVERTA